MSNEMRLENWRKYGSVVIGNVYGNPRFDEGERVTTSKVISTDGKILKTFNSTYILGEPEKNSNE